MRWTVRPWYDTTLPSAGGGSGGGTEEGVWEDVCGAVDGGAVDSGTWHSGEMDSGEGIAKTRQLWAEAEAA